MNSILAIAALLICGFIALAVPSLIDPQVVDYGSVTVFDTSRAVLLCGVVAAAAGFIVHKGPNGRFLLQLFISALLVRILIGTVIFVSNGQDFFGGDALQYDYFGYAQVKAWSGDRYSQSMVDGFVGKSGLGSGMVYLVAGIYQMLGRNMLAVQFFNAVLGSATAIIIFLCAYQVFNNMRVARLSGIAVAFYPSLVLWSSQGLKDAPIVFLLALSILATLKLGEKLSLKWLLVLIVSLLALLSFRFYVFYMIAIAIGGAFIMGMQALSATSFIRQVTIVIVLGLAFTYFGVTRSANIQLERYGSLQQVQRSRQDASTSAQSGFGKEVDVSTTRGALTTIPLGLLYLLFAPFPWQLASLRQSITLPEMIVWWASFPLLILGLWFSIKYKLRQISPVLIFTVMLSLAYSVFQGNVGTAYRQRAQLLVFYFIFVAVGYVLLLEKHEEKKRAKLAERQTSLGIISSSVPRRE